MDRLIFGIAGIFVAGIWGYILVSIAGSNRRVLKDDSNLSTDKEKKEAKRSMRLISLMSPVWIFVVVVGIAFLINAKHPFFRVNAVGLALILGGILFAYLGWAIGTAIKRAKDDLGDKDAKFFSRAFMISFIGSGLVVVAFGIMVCVSPV